MPEKRGPPRIEIKPKIEREIAEFYALTYIFNRSTFGGRRGKDDIVQVLHGHTVKARQIKNQADGWFVTGKEQRENRIKFRSIFVVDINTQVEIPHGKEAEYLEFEGGLTPPIT